MLIVSEIGRVVRLTFPKPRPLWTGEEGATCLVGITAFQEEVEVILAERRPWLRIGVVEESFVFDNLELVLVKEGFEVCSTVSRSFTMCCEDVECF